MNPAPTRVRKDERLIRAALDARDYRSFITNALVASAGNGGKPNIAAVSRKAGFSSRSFISDVIDGRRRLSARSYPMMVRALGLTPKLKSYFHLLVVKEEEKLNFEGLKTQQIEARLVELRSKLLAALSSSQIEEQTVSTMTREREMLDVHAALGSLELGTTEAEICRKTDLPAEIVRPVLEQLLRREVAVLKDGRYYPANPVVFFQDMGADENVKKLYMQTLDEMRRKANAGFNMKDRAFFGFVYSVDRAQMPELKKRLWDVMQEFMESSEKTDGDAVAKLAVGFYI